MEERIIGTSLAIIIAVLVLVLVMYHFNLWALTPWGNGCPMGLTGTAPAATQAQSAAGSQPASVIDMSYLNGSPDLMVS